MKNAGKKILLNMAVGTNVLIFTILSVIAFWSIGFANGDTLGSGLASTSSPYFWLALFGIIFVIIAIILPFIKLFIDNPKKKKIIDLINFTLVTIAVCLMLASQIQFIIDLEEGVKPNVWKIIGSFALIFIGYSVTVQPQVKLIFVKNKTIKSNLNESNNSSETKNQDH